MSGARRIGWALATAAALGPLGACSLAIDFSGLDDSAPDAQSDGARSDGASSDAGTHPTDGSTAG